MHRRGCGTQLHEALKTTEMKKFILTLALAAAAAGIVKADEVSESILRHISQALADYGSYEVKFSVTAKGMGTMNGNYYVSGDKYRIKLQRQEQFSDGVNRYEIYPADKEVVIDKADTSSHDILNNPTRAFEFAPEEFESTYKGQRTVNRTVSETVELVPRKGTPASGTITLFVDTENGLPVALDYDYQGEHISITIDKLAPVRDIDTSMFIFDPSRYGDYEVIDFR